MAQSAAKVCSHHAACFCAGRQRTQSDFYASPQRLLDPGPAGRADWRRGSLDGAACGGAQASPQESWPPPVKWTVSADVFDYRTIILNFNDIHLPSILQPAIEVPHYFPQGTISCLLTCQLGLEKWHC